MLFNNKTKILNSEIQISIIRVFFLNYIFSIKLIFQNFNKNLPNITQPEKSAKRRCVYSPKLLIIIALKLSHHCSSYLEYNIVNTTIVYNSTVPYKRADLDFLGSREFFCHAAPSVPLSLSLYLKMVPIKGAAPII